MCFLFVPESVKKKVLNQISVDVVRMRSPHNDVVGWGKIHTNNVFMTYS